MYRVLFLLILFTSLLAGCSSNLGNSYDPPKFPSSPSTIIEENGWKSLLIIPERNRQGEEITFENYLENDYDSGISNIHTRVAGQHELLFFAEHNNFKEGKRYYWLYRVNVSGQITESKRMNELDYHSWSFEGDTSIYSYKDNAIYKDGSLASSHANLGSVESEYLRVSVGEDKDVLINGKYYFDWQTQSWKNVKPIDINVESSDYFISTIKDSNHLAGWSIVQNQDGKKAEFQFTYQELDMTTSSLTQSQTFGIEAESIYDELQAFGTFDEIYAFIVKRDRTTGSLYVIDRLTGRVETRFKSLPLPNPGKLANGFDGQFSLAGDRSIFYISALTGGPVLKDLSIYQLGESLEFVDITPTKVEDSVGISDIYAIGNRLYIHLRNNFCIASGDCVPVRQIAYYEVQSQKSESVSSSYPIQKIFSSRE